MNLGQQLTELRFNILRDRSDIIAGDSDSLWTDETLLMYIKDAERRFARQSMILRDGDTSAITLVKLEANVSNYPLDKSIIAVISSRYQLDSYDLPRAGHSLLYQLNAPEFLNWNDALQAQYPPGKPIAYYTDETLVYAGSNRVTLSIFPVPSATENGNTVKMRVIRVPTTCYDRDHLDVESQLPEDYQLSALRWAAYLAQSTFDADAGAPTSAADHKKAFDEAVKDAVKERKRMMFASEQIKYGMNGFRWTR
jgi:hypothetical protein